MTLDQIETFIAVAKEGGLRAASVSLHKTQPTLSTALKNLEAELGVTLFDRSGYRVGLTEKGKVLLEKALVLKAQQESFVKMAEDFNQGLEPILKLAIDYLTPKDLISEILHFMQSKCSSTVIEIDFVVLSGAQEKINQETHIAISPFFSQQAGLEIEQIDNINVAAVMAKSLAGKKLSEIPQIVVKEKNPLHSFEITEKSKSMRWFVSDHLMKKELIEQGLGWGHLEASSASGLVKIKEIPDKKLPLLIARKSNTTKGIAATAFWNQMLK